MRAVLHEYGARAVPARRFERALKLAGSHHRKALNVKTEPETRGFGLPECQYTARITFG